MSALLTEQGSSFNLDELFVQINRQVSLTRCRWSHNKNDKRFIGHYLFSRIERRLCASSLRHGNVTFPVTSS